MISPGMNSGVLKQIFLPDQCVQEALVSHDGPISNWESSLVQFALNAEALAD